MGSKMIVHCALPLFITHFESINNSAMVYQIYTIAGDGSTITLHFYAISWKFIYNLF